MAHAQEIESIHEEESDVLLVSNATAVVPLYQQKRVWAFLILICGVSALLGNLLGSTGNGVPVADLLAPLVPSSAPSLTHQPSNIPSLSRSSQPSPIPSFSNLPSNIPSLSPSSKPSAEHSSSPTDVKQAQRAALLQFFDDDFRC